MNARDERKAEYEGYRFAAQLAVASNMFPETSDGMRVHIEGKASVSATEDGAYVDAVIWIPRRVMERAR